MEAPTYTLKGPETLTVSGEIGRLQLAGHALSVGRKGGEAGTSP